MAFVTHVKQVPGKVRRHPTQVIAEVKIDDDSERDIIVQIDTRGSKEREIEGKLESDNPVESRHRSPTSFAADQGLRIPKIV